MANDGLDPELTASLSRADSEFRSLRELGASTQAVARSLAAVVDLDPGMEDGSAAKQDWEYYVEVEGRHTAMYLIHGEGRVLARSLVDHLSALGELLRIGHHALAPVTLTRSIQEAAIRLAWLLDLEVDTNTRLQRAVHLRLNRFWSTAEVLRLAQVEVYEWISALEQELIELIAEEDWQFAPGRPGKPPRVGAFESTSSLVRRHLRDRDPEVHDLMSPIHWKMGSSATHGEMLLNFESSLVLQGWSDPDPAFLRALTRAAPWAFALAASAIAAYWDREETTSLVATADLLDGQWGHSARDQDGDDASGNRED